MNIFLIMLMSVFMAGYYMFFAPNTKIAEQETDRAIAVSDLRSVAQCALAVHNAQINNNIFEDVCVEQNQITSDFVCLDSRQAITDCGAEGFKRPTASFIITTTGAIHTSDYNGMMEILEKGFSNNGSFGIYQDGVIIAAGTVSKRNVPESIQNKFNLQNGQLVYMTHYDRPDEARTFTNPEADNVVCPPGTTKTYRFGRWQCMEYNLKTSCGGDMMWDSNLMECVPDETRKPLCAGQQTAVIVDEVWECVNPFGERTCPNGMVARLNYEALEWECVEDPNNARVPSKCKLSAAKTIRGRGGATLRVTTNLCTDCEKLVVDEENCTAVCIPDPIKLYNSSCYPGRPQECSGMHRAFYFGFPNESYVGHVAELAPANVPFDSMHSQNRRFNCLDCGDRQVDTSASVYPFVAVCKD
jgi:hypothetical protein